MDDEKQEQLRAMAETVLDDNFPTTPQYEFAETDAVWVVTVTAAKRGEPAGGSFKVNKDDNAISETTFFQ